MRRAKLERRLERLRSEGKTHLRAARRAQAHLDNKQWEPTGLRTFIYSPWKQERKPKRARTVQNVRAKEHVTTKIKSALFGPNSLVVRWAQGLRIRKGSR